MNTDLASLAAVTILGALIAGASTGCVSSGTYQEAQRRSAMELQYEQRASQQLTAANNQLKGKIDELERALRTVREDQARTEKLWKETRDELLRLKIEQEQQRPRVRERLSQLDRPDFPGRAEEAVRRLKDLLRQLQATLDQFSSREPL